MMPSGNGVATFGSGGAGNTVVKIFVPNTGAGVAMPYLPKPAGPPTPMPVQVFGGTAPITTPQPPMSAGGVSTGGAQVLAINVTGPTTISQSVSVGPNASGCSPAAGGTSCQLSLTLPAGTYTGTVANSAVGFTIAPNASNQLNLTMSGVPAQMQIVPASFMSVQNAQGGIDLYGAGKHALIVEMLDANQNVIVGNAGASFALSQAGGSLPLSVTQAKTLAPNLFYVSSPPATIAASGILRATASFSGALNPCVQNGAICSGTVRVDMRQILGVANSNANTVTLYANGQPTPLATIQNSIASPQALIFDPAGSLFVANQTGSVSVYAAPYNQAPVAITNGVNRPQALALDTHGNLFVANGGGSNTVTVYASPYGGRPSQIISAGVDDPVSLALDASANLFVLNGAANTVTEYAAPYTSTPTIISKGLNAPNSLALDSHGNLFVANLNSTPNSVVEYTPPFTNQSAPAATITNGVNEQGAITLSSAANLFVPNQGANTVTEYVAPYSNPPTTIVGGQSQPIALAIDSNGNLYVANYGNNSVTEYPPPYAGASWTTLSMGVSAPIALALSPATNSGSTLLP
jgi:NHL repeat